MRTFAATTTLVILAGALHQGAGMLGIEELPMTELERGEGYKLVRIPKSKWICTGKELDVNMDPLISWQREFSSRSEAWQMAGNRMLSKTFFDKLFRYIYAGNKGEEIIGMTLPVVNNIKPIDGTRYQHTMCFWTGTPWENRKLPTPKRRDIFEMEMPAKDVYVMTFGGYVLTIQEWRDRAAELMGKLEKDNAGFNKDHYYAVGYDAPFVPEESRTNEIWIEKM